MGPSEALGDFVQTHAPGMAAALALEAPPPERAALETAALEWLGAAAGHLDGQTDRAPAAIAALMSRLSAAEMGPEHALRLIQGFRRAALQAWAAAHGPGRDLDILPGLLRVEDRHAEELVHWCSQSERERIASERRRVRTLAEALDLAVAALDAEGAIQLANGLFSRALGLPLEAVVGRAMTDFCDPAAAQSIRRALRQRRNAAGSSFSGRLLTPDGAGVAMRFTVRPTFGAQGLRDGLAVTMERAGMHESGAADYLRSIIEQIAEAIEAAFQVFDRDRRVLFETAHCRDLMPAGCEPGSTLCCLLTRCHEKGPHACLCERAITDGQPYTDTASADFGEGLRWFTCMVAPLRDPAGAVHQLACVVRDITAQRQLEHEVLRQQRSSLVSQVATAVGQQLRNPLAVVLGFAEMLQSQGIAPEKLPSVSDRLLRNALRCKNIVEDLFEFGHGTAADATLCDIGRVLRGMVEPLYPPADRERIAWRIGEGLGPVLCVPAQLSQVFASLIDNALHAGAQRVSVHAAGGEDSVLVRVADDGPGVPPELRDRIFLPFFTTNKPGGALGLGLTLSQTVVREYGGDIEFDPAHAPGAAFVVRLPRARAQSRPDNGAVDAPRVLVVDDELDLLEVLVAALELRGYRVDGAPTAAEALALLGKHRYDAAVFDVNLPGSMGGPDLFAHVQRTQPALAERTLFITADTMSYETRRFLERTRRPAMEKPFLVSDFSGRVAQLLGPAAAAGSA